MMGSVRHDMMKQDDHGKRATSPANPVANNDVGSEEESSEKELPPRPAALGPVGRVTRWKRKLSLAAQRSVPPAAGSGSTTRRFAFFRQGPVGELRNRTNEQIISDESRLKAHTCQCIERPDREGLSAQHKRRLRRGRSHLANIATWSSPPVGTLD